LRGYVSPGSATFRSRLLLTVALVVQRQSNHSEHIARNAVGDGNYRNHLEHQTPLQDLHDRGIQGQSVATKYTDIDTHQTTPQDKCRDSSMPYGLAIMPNPMSSAEHDKVFGNIMLVTSLEDGYSIHAGERPYRCMIPGCGKTFKHKKRLPVHNRIHTGEKPYRCNYVGCEKQCITSSALARHQQTHESERTRYKCPQAGCTERLALVDFLVNPS
jgi:hypothetical protein